MSNKKMSGLRNKNTVGFDRLNHGIADSKFPTNRIYGEKSAAAPRIPPSPNETFEGIRDESERLEPSPRKPKSSDADSVGAMIKDAASQLPTLESDWLDSASAKAVLGTAPGGMLDSILGGMGIPNPVATGPMGNALGTALQAAGLGAFGNPAGSDALSSPLDDLGNAIGGCFPSNHEPESDIMYDTTGGCFPGSNTENSEIANQIGADALDAAADKLLAEWKVDDQSSAVEHVANKAVNDNKDTIKDAAADPTGFMSRMQAYFCGAAVGTGMPAVRISDLDDSDDISTMGVATILFEGLPVSRISDMVIGPKAPAPGMQIIQGAATVLSAELPTAFVGAATAVPSVMINGAKSILVGGVVASVSPPAISECPKTNTNDAPAVPEPPRSPESASDSDSSNEIDATSEQGEPSDSLSDLTDNNTEAQTQQLTSRPLENSDGTSQEATETTDPISPSEEDGHLKNTQSDTPYHEREDSQNPTSVVTRDGVLSKDEHEQRNQYNYVPETIPEDGLTDEHGIKWKERPLEKTLFHQDGVQQAWEDPNRCFEGSHPAISPGTYEACYKPDGTPHPSSTYNYYGSEHTLPHTQCDVAPAIHGDLVYGPHWPPNRKPVCPAPDSK